MALAVVVGLVSTAHGTHAHLHDHAQHLQPRQFSALTYQGCFSSAGELTKNTSYIYNTQGYCQTQCVPAGYNVEAVSAAKDCYCGNALPPASDKVDDSKCNAPCAGFDEVMCGGTTHFSVYLTGLADQDVVGASDEAQAVSSSATTSATPSVVTVGGETMTVTAGAQIPKESSESSGPNKAGIAAGVVVGVLAIAAILAGVFFFMRHKKRREAEEEQKHATAVNSFIAGGEKGPTSSAGASFDSHLDQSIMASKRMSNGSLADDADYSRRILKVTNA